MTNPAVPPESACDPPTLEGGYRLQRWIPVGLGVTFGTLLLLIGLPLPRDTVTGEITTDYLRLTTTAPLETGDMGARRLTVAFRGKLEGAGMGNAEDQRLNIAIDAPIAQAGDLGEGAGMTPVITVRGTEFPTGSDLSLAIDQSSNNASVMSSGSEVTLTIFAPEGAQILLQSEDCLAAQNCQPYRQPRGADSFTIRASAEDETKIEFDLPERVIPISDGSKTNRLDTWEIVDSSSGKRRRSGLTDGSIQFASSASSSQRFLPGEIIHLRPRALDVRAVRIGDRAVRVQYSGVVSGAFREIGEKRVTFMPSWFDALSQNLYVRCVLGALSIFLSIAGFLKLGPSGFSPRSE